MELPTPLVAPEVLLADPELLARVVFWDTRRGPTAESDYAAEHLAGAIRVELDRDLSGDLSNPSEGGRHPLPSLEEWCARLGRWGIRPDTPVVAYDDKGGALSAARAWWMLHAVGHRNVAVLDGGIQAARAAGLPMSAEVPVVEAVDPYPASGWTAPTVDMEAIETLRSSDEHLLIDVRAAERYAGEHEPIDPVAGHIPGAVNDPLWNDLRDGRFLPVDQLRARLLGVLGGVAPENTILSCGSGVTACHTLLALEAAGLSGAALYVGSWSEWCRNHDQPA